MIGKIEFNEAIFVSYLSIIPKNSSIFLSSSAV